METLMAVQTKVERTCVWAHAPAQHERTALFQCGRHHSEMRMRPSHLYVHYIEYNSTTVEHNINNEVSSGRLTNKRVHTKTISTLKHALKERR